MSAVTVLGYLQPCNNCGVSALLGEPDRLWTCPDCTGEDPEPDDPMERAYAAVREFFDVLQQVRRPKLEGAALDTVAALDDEDPEPMQLGPDAAAEAVADWHQTGYLEG